VKGLTNTEKLVIAFAIFIVLAGVFVGIGQYFKSLDISTVPEFARDFVLIVQKFFSYGSVTFVVMFLRNILGYARNWLTLHKTQAVEYELQRYYNTIMYYVGVFNVILSAVPEPYNWIGAVFAFAIDVFTAEWKKIQPQPQATS
jgi:flagellar biosynthesis protein FlhB